MVNVISTATVIQLWHRDDGYQIVGNALPDFVMSLGSNLRWGAFWI